MKRVKPARLTLSKKPQRIVCLTEEPTETLYLLGEDHRIVGITAFTCRPSQAKKRHPVVSGFTGGNLKKIVELAPDLVIGFSDIQAQLARDLIARQVPVLIFNQRSLQEILDVILMMGRLVGREKRAQALVRKYIRNLQSAAARTKRQKKLPKVYFEEWDDPMIHGIQWVSELIERAGGQDIFRERARGKSAKERFTRPEEVAERAPEIFIGSWCGKPLDIHAVRSRPGWNSIPAVAMNRIYEMDPSIILQPGPASMTDGLNVLEEIIRSGTGSQVDTFQRKVST